MFWAASVLPFCNNKYTRAIVSAALLIGLRGLLDKINNNSKLKKEKEKVTITNSNN